MTRLHSLVYLLPQLWRTLFTRPITVRYPFAPLELPPYFRGRVVINIDLCRGCGLCVRDCPAFALELERESDTLSPSKGHDKFQLIHYHDRCACCGQCQDVCRYEAIWLTSEYVPAAADRDVLREEFGLLGEFGTREVNHAV
ncbi:MAG: 4Fe-4S binding protein [Chloroflexi bacterium]|nr:4Fe-4S binding protein [Chloroflexota bacterium]